MHSISLYRDAFSPTYDGIRTVGIGFCGENILGDTMPGCFPGSWAYHGGDRVLYVGTGEEAATRSPDLPEAEMYDVGDTVGVCWNSEASEALCTLNGKKLHIGELPSIGKDEKSVHC